MRYSILLLFGLFLIANSIYIGAEELEKFAPRPHHPLDPLQGRPRIMADEIRSQNYIGDSEYAATFSYSTIKYSNDGLSDTIYFSSGVIPPPIVQLYSKENRLIMIKYDHNMNGDFDDDEAKEVYTYNTSGWLVNKFSYNGQSSSIIFSYDYRNIIHTDSGYILKNVEYILDEQGRLTRMDDVRYTYFENGYIEYSTRKNRPHKSEHYHNQEGYPIKTLDYTLLTNGKWELDSRREITYIFNDPSDSEDISPVPQPVYGTNGAIIITASIKDPVYIHNINGQLVKRIGDTQPNERISIPKGIYIVTIQQRSYKVIVD